MKNKLVVLLTATSSFVLAFSVIMLSSNNGLNKGFFAINKRDINRNGFVINGDNFIHVNGEEESEEKYGNTFYTYYDYFKVDTPSGGYIDCSLTHEAAGAEVHMSSAWEEDMTKETMGTFTGHDWQGASYYTNFILDLTKSDITSVTFSFSAESIVPYAKFYRYNPVDASDYYYYAADLSDGVAINTSPLTANYGPHNGQEFTPNYIKIELDSVTVIRSITLSYSCTD